MKKTTIAIIALLILLIGGVSIAVRVLLAPDRVRSAIETQLSSALGQTVRIGSAGARIFPNVGLELRDVRIANTATRLDSVSLETGLRPLFSRRVENASITIARGHVEIPWLVALLTTVARVPSPPSGLTVASIRTIELRDVALAAGQHELRLDADGLYQDDRLEVERLEAEGDGTAFTARGALASVSRVIGTFAVDADTLNLDALLALASRAAPAASPAPASDRNRSSTRDSGFAIDANVKARSGRGASIAFNNLSTHMRVTAAGIRLDPLSLQAFDGRFSGRMGIRTSSSVPETSVTGDVGGVDVSSLSTFVGSPGAISGRLSGRAAVICACIDLASVRARMAGKGRFEITNGAIPGLQIVRTVVLAFGRPASDAPPPSGERFSRIAAAFTMARGTIATDDLALASPDFDMRAAGTLSTMTGAIDFTANVVLSPGLSRQAGTDLVRYAHEGDRVILPATLSGTVASPRVFINLREALERALRNELERRGRSLLDRLLRRKPGGGA